MEEGAVQMEQWRKNAYVLWVAVFVAAVAWTMVMPFTPQYLQELGQETGVEMWSGVIIATAAVCSMVMAPIWGAVGDRFGRRMMMLRAGLFLVIGNIAMSFAVGPVSLLLVRAGIGGLTGFVPMAIALVGVSTPQEHVGRALGLVQTAWPSGAIIGPVIGGIAADAVGIGRSAWVAAAMVAFATILVLINVKEEFSPPKTTQPNILGDLKAAASHKGLMAVVVITLTAQAAIMALEPVLVPFVNQMVGANAPSWVSGLLFSIPGVAFIAMASWWARLGERHGYLRTVGMGLIGSALLYGLQAFAGNPWQLGGLRLLSGVTGAAIGPGVAALLATTVSKDLRGRAFGLNQSASSAGTILGPLLGGYIGSYLDPRGVFVLAGLLYLVGGLWVYRVVQPMLGRAGVSGPTVTD